MDKVNDLIAEALGIVDNHIDALSTELTVKKMRLIDARATMKFILGELNQAVHVDGEDNLIIDNPDKLKEVYYLICRAVWDFSFSDPEYTVAKEKKKLVITTFK